MGQRNKDNQWTVSLNSDGMTYSMEAAHLCVLMDLRDELKQLNRVFACRNFLAIPGRLEAIRRNTRKPKKKKPAVA